MKKRILLFLILAFCLPATLFSQHGGLASSTEWKLSTSAPFGGLMITSLHFIPNSNRIGFASGMWGAIFKTTDGGVSWSAKPCGTTEDIQKIKFVNDKVGFAVGWRYIYKSTDGGETWNIVHTRIFTRFMDVSFSDINQGVVVGAGQGMEGVILRTEDGGKTWSESKAVKALTALTFHDSQTGFAVGEGLILKTSDGGKSWQESMVSGDFLFSIDFASPTRGFVVGMRGTLYQTTDAGKTWEKQRLGYKNLKEVYFLSPQIGIIAGDNIILKTIDGGKSWNEAECPEPNDFLTISFADATTGYLAGFSGSLYKSTNTGSSWKRESNGTGQNLRSIHFCDERNGMAVGWKTVVKTVNGGKDWIEPKRMNDHFTAIHMVTPSLVFASCDYKLLSSTDGGSTWVPVIPSSPASLEFVYFLNGGKTGFVTGSKGLIMKTIDGGKSWTIIDTGIKAQLVSMDFYDNDHGVIVGFDGAILTTRDGGNTWKTYTFDQQNLFSVAYVTQDKLIAVGNGGYILASTDGGETWARLKGITDEHLGSVFFSDVNQGIIAGKNTILRTTDGGKQWVSQKVNFPRYALEAVYITPAGQAFVAGDNGIILTTEFNK